MKLTDKKVYVVGFRKTDNDDWETSGKTYGNLVDAVATKNAISKQTEWQTHVFVSEKFRFVKNIEMEMIEK